MKQEQQEQLSNLLPHCHKHHRRRPCKGGYRYGSPLPRHEGNGDYEAGEQRFFIYLTQAFRLLIRNDRPCLLFVHFRIFQRNSIFRESAVLRLSLRIYPPANLPTAHPRPPTYPQTYF